jgi:hypothetical protein
MNGIYVVAAASALSLLCDFMDETAKGFSETSFYARRGWIYST